MALGRIDKSAKETRQESVDNRVVREKIHTLSAAKNWYIDRHQRLILQRNFLLIATLVSMFFLGITVLSVSELNKRKVFEPFVIEVEDKSGIVTQVSHRDIETYTSEEVIIKYFINKYIQAREGYHPNDYVYNYFQVVRLLSAGDVFSAFNIYLNDKDNNDTPLKLARNTMRRPIINSITYLDKGTAQETAKTLQIRITTEDVPLDNPNTVYSRKSWIITLRFNFVLLDLGQSERFINPLGFQVMSYQKVSETTDK